MRMRVSAIVVLLSSLVLASSFALAGRALQATDLVAPIDEDHLYYVDEVVGQQVKVRKVDTDGWFIDADKPVEQFLGNEQAVVEVKDLRRMTLSFTPDNHLPILQEARDADCAEMDLAQMLRQDLKEVPPALAPGDVEVDSGCCACLKLKKIFGRRNH